ncbi:hypothetical protein Rsub_05266 [Raphidocelis subcapitata]|uniref:Uncharacterized protein n=1 Tax=Raphidocelis subcapitata TaxID=307507 RepID=A0A2V0NX24_9CHLO|nr:hypothetical protein Rsub_05266 [Raphidocelis subcapitata]|eukprot:GBF92184.1 hypothetical protein Rsub_05266 [Raphidocelis subcapitata]
MAAATRWALVTGGNRGLGLAVCKELAGRGKSVILTTRDTAAGQKAAEEVRAAAKEGAKVEVLELEAADAASRARLASAVASRFDRSVDLLVVNAGIIHKTWTPEGFAQSAAVNFGGAVDTALAVAPHLAEGAVVIFVSSTLGQLSKLSPDYAEPISSAKNLGELRAAAARFDPSSPMPAHNTYSPDYSVSKAALNRAVQLMAADGALRPAGAAAAVCPGWCRTDMGTSAADRSAEEGAASILAPWYRAAKEGAAAVNGSFTRDGEVIEW